MNARERFRPYNDPAEFDKIIEMDAVTDMWRHCTEQYADLPAIVFQNEAHTFAQLDADAADFRAVLAGQVKENARVAILARNSYDFVRAYLATVTLGMTAVILPPQLDSMTVMGCCMLYGVSALVFDPALAEKTEAVRAKLPLPLIDITSVSGKTEPMRDCTAKTPCVIMFTGGTTGKSKGALLSHRAVMEGTVNGCYGIPEIFGQRYLLVLPFFHVFGLIRNLMTSLYTGSALMICENNKNMFRDIAMFRPTVLVDGAGAGGDGALTLSKKFGRNMLGDDLKTIICGAAAVAPYLVVEYDKLGIRLLPGYGLTESANLVSGNPENLTRPTSVGLPYPNQELRIVDGELWIRGANMMDGYVGEDNAAAYSDGWFKTGDLARFDDDGFLYITGRIKEIILLPNGENVSPAEVEAHFNALPFVQDSQVFEAVTDSGRHILALEVVPRATVIGKMGLDDPNGFILAELEKVNETLPDHQRVRPHDRARQGF